MSPQQRWQTVLGSLGNLAEDFSMSTVDTIKIANGNDRSLSKRMGKIIRYDGTHSKLYMAQFKA